MGRRLEGLASTLLVAGLALWGVAYTVDATLTGRTDNLWPYWWVGIAVALVLAGIVLFAVALWPRSDAARIESEPQPLAEPKPQAPVGLAPSHSGFVPTKSWDQTSPGTGQVEYTNGFRFEILKDDTIMMTGQEGGRIGAFISRTGDLWHVEHIRDGYIGDFPSVDLAIRAIVVRGYNW